MWNMDTEVEAEVAKKLIPFHPCHGWDTFHYPRLFQALSSLALGTARDPGAAPAALGILCQGLPTLPGNNSCPKSNLNFPSFSMSP